MNKINFKGDFFKNAFILITGTGLAQAIPLLFSPLLTRLFSPEDFGRLAFFMAISSVLAIISTGLYELSIMLPKRDIIAINILFLVVILSFILSLLFFILILFFGSFLNKVFYNPVSFQYLLLLPVAVFFTGGAQGLNYWLNRKKKYKLINACKISQSIGTVVISLYLGYLGFKSYGLIIGFVSGCFISTLPLFYLFIKRQLLISKSIIINTAKMYLDYPRLMMPTAIMNTSATQAPVFFINKFFLPSIVGSYSFASRMLTAPTGILSSAIGQIYFQKMSELVKVQSKNIFPSFLKTAKTLTTLSACLFIPFFFFGESFFRIVFGANWAEAGKYVEIISIGAFIKFIVSPLSTIFISLNKLRVLAAWQILYFCTTIIIFLIGRNFTFTNLLWLYVIHEFVLYSIYFLLMVNASKKFTNYCRNLNCN